MSRSNPSENSIPNPAKRWFEWNGEEGAVRYYDKDTKKNVVVGDDFTFILLDQLGTVKGWHDASESGIYSNQVRDTTQEVFVVKSFKGGTLAEGLYREIREHVTSKAVGGQFVAVCYCAFKDDAGQLQLGAMQFKGAALNAWVEFGKANRADLYKHAVRIKGFNEDKKGRIVFRVPVLVSQPISPETDKQAIALDKQLQEYLTAYFKRTRRDQAEDAHQGHADDDAADGGGTYDEHEPVTTQVADDDIPF